MVRVVATVLTRPSPLPVCGTVLVVGVLKRRPGQFDEFLDLEQFDLAARMIWPSLGL
jgi:hypothetical protein